VVPQENDDTLNGQAQAALNLLQQGRVRQAEEICLQILSSDPHHFHGLHLRGIIALQKPDAAQAVKFLRAATQSEPAQPAAWSNLAAALLAVNQPVDALTASDAALRIQSSLPEGLVNRGHALVALGRHQEALAMYQRAVTVSPRRVDAHVGAGNALRMLERFQESLAHFEHARALDPESADVLVDAARALLLVHRPEAALELLSTACRLKPTSAAALTVRGSALRQLQRPSEALASYEAALRLRPDHAEIHSNIANVYLHVGRLEDSLLACDMALAIDPMHVQAANIRAHTLRGLGRYVEAAAAFDRLLANSPEFPYARGNRLYARAWVCDWTNYAQEVASIRSAVTEGKRACQPLSFLAIAHEPEEQLACAQIAVADRFPAQRRDEGLPRIRGDHIRIAYVSADFRNHPVAYLLAGVLEGHDRGRFRTFALSIENDPRDSAIKSRIQHAVDHYEDVSRLSDREVAERLRALEIDIAVDLNGHTLSSRLGIFATHPAPVQVGFLGYTGTTGASYIDYLLADATALPDSVESGFSESIVRLPYCFLPNDDCEAIAEPTPARESVGLPAKAFVYCAFNNPYKINPTMFDVWIRLLHETEGSVLWLKGESPAVVENLRHEARARGVAPERLVFAPQIPKMEEHLARYRCADLFLDTLPYGAHATSRDALWAGLPVLTCAGRAFSSRVAASLLIGLGLPELVATSLDDYAGRAIELVSHSASLGALRARLASNRTSAPVFSTHRYCRALEAAFAGMLERQRSGVARQSFAVSDPAASQ
jgi:protein O-GlcNAc transferase